MTERTVWICERGMLHEGGGVEAIYESREGARAWLDAQRESALAGAREMRWWEPERKWEVSQIVDEATRASFEDNIMYWAVREMSVRAPAVEEMR